jgi:hypothetical protein
MVQNDSLRRRDSTVGRRHLLLGAVTFAMESSGM